MSNPHARLSLGDVLRERAMKRPAFSTNTPVQWELVPGGIRPFRREAADCHASAPDSGNPCYNKPVWVIEGYDGFFATCLTHSGVVVNSVLPPVAEAAETELVFHPYKGA
jgi:hypothetical protein